MGYTAREAWESYAECCLQGCPMAIRKTLQAVFYAGMTASVLTMKRAAIEFGEERGEPIVGALLAELESYADAGLDHHGRQN